MNYVFELIDENNKKIRLTKERWRHILKHPHMPESNQVDNIQSTLKDPTTIRYNEEDKKVKYFYKEFKYMPTQEKYMLVSVKYLNGEGFIITSFFTNKITGLKSK